MHPRPRSESTRRRGGTDEALAEAEALVREGGRLVQWAAVERPELARTARLVFTAASRIRGDRLQARVAA
jgi:hypothetical protein